MRFRWPLSPPLVALPGAALALTMGITAPAHAQSSSDVWDVSKGTIVTAYSPTVLNSNPEGMFGGTNSGIPGEAGNTIFGDGQAAGYAHYIEWQTLAPVTVGGFSLYAQGDGEDLSHRAYGRFRLLYWTGSAFSAVYDYTPASSNTAALTFTDIIPTTTASLWRAEFYTTAVSGGPRVIELDAVRANAPEPGALSLLLPLLPVMGGVGLVRRRKLRQSA